MTPRRSPMGDQVPWRARAPHILGGSGTLEADARLAMTPWTLVTMRAMAIMAKGEDKIPPGEEA